MGPKTLRLTLFDLDHTLLDGDSDQLWCEFLMERGVLPREPFEASQPRDGPRLSARPASARRTSATSTSARWPGAAPTNGTPLRRDWLDSRIVPRIPAAALALVARHRDAGDLVVLSTATCRFLSELTAAHLGIAQLIATECEIDAQGRFSGRSRGVLNMREGKVQRLHDWLATQKLALADCESTLYSDSINDLPLLSARAPLRWRWTPMRNWRRGARARLAGDLPALTTEHARAQGPLTVIGSYLSPYVRKVLVCLDIEGHAPTRIDPIVPFYGNDEFARLSPLRRVPVLIDGDGHAGRLDGDLRVPRRALPRTAVAAARTPRCAPGRAGWRNTPTRAWARR